MRDVVVDSGVKSEELKQVATASVTLPEGFVSYIPLYMCVIARCPDSCFATLDTCVVMLLCSQTVHDRLKRGHIEPRLKLLAAGKDIDWATAEAMAFGSLMKQGYNVRICGQDVVRDFVHITDLHCVLSSVAFAHVSWGLFFPCSFCLVGAWYLLSPPQCVHQPAER